MKAKKQKAFTLIELLAVIIILGILLLIAIPSVTSYIANSRKKVYIAIADQYRTATINKINSLEFLLTNPDVTYYVPVECIELEKGGKSPYGEWKEAYVVVEFDGDKYNYYWTSYDSASMGVEIKEVDKLTTSDVISKSTMLKDSINEASYIGIFNSACEPVISAPEEEVITDFSNTLKPSTSVSFLGTSINRSLITKIEFKQSIVPPANVVNTYDVGIKPNEVYMWIDNQNKITIGANSKIIANQNSSYLFYGFSSITELKGLENIDTSKANTMKYMFYGLSALQELDLNNFDTAKVRDMSYMFRDASGINNLNLSSFNTSKVIDMSYMFYDMQNLQSLNISNFDTLKVKNMTYMFGNLSSLQSLNLSGFNTKNVVSMPYMFRGVSALINLDLSKFNTSSVEDMAYMFYDMQNLQSLNINNFDTSKVKNMTYMFGNLGSLQSLDLSSFNTKNVVSMPYMFRSVSSLITLDLSNFNTASVKDMSYMFYNMQSLKNLNLSNFNTSKVENMTYMFSNLGNLQNLDVSNFNTKNVKNMTFMFRGMTSLSSLDLSSFDTANVENMQSMFRNTKFDVLDLRNFNFENADTTDLFAEINKNLIIYVKNQASLDLINSFSISYLNPSIV